jgi:hypothetical protein
VISRRLSMLAETPAITLHEGQLGSFAVPYRKKLPEKPVRLMTGTLLRTPPSSFWEDVPKNVSADLDLTPEGHTGVWIGLLGVFLIPGGDVAAVYGGVVASVGSAHEP